MLRDIVNKFLSKETSIHLLKILLIVAAWEAVIMYSLSFIKFDSFFLEATTDTFFLAFLSGITIIFLVFMPEKKKAEKEMADSVNFLGQEFRAVGEIGIISTCDLDGKIIYVNDNFCKLSGYSRKELLGQDHRIMNSDFHSKDFFKEMWLQLQAGKPWQGQIRNVKKNGDIYWVHSYNTPIVNNKGKICKYLSFRLDITNEKKIEDSLEQEILQSIHLSRLSAIGEMAAGVAHEINNPLAIISGLLSITKRKLQGQLLTEDVKKIQEIISKVQGQVVRTAKITNSLREFSRGGDQSSFEETSTHKVLETVSELCYEKLVKNNVRLDVLDDGIKFQCNQIQVEQVLVNLISNSIDAIRDLDNRWIKIDVSSNNNFLEMSVTDSGTGISKDVAKNIMQPFYTTKAVGKGTGLGLSISFGIIKQHGGTLYPDTVAKNTRFVIQLPLHAISLVNLINYDQEIDKHLELRQKILIYISNPSSDLDYEKSRADYNGIIEKWIERIEPRFKNEQNFIELKASYLEFYNYAGDIIRMATNQETRHSLEDGSEYDNRSKRFISALLNFKVLACEAPLVS
jgi:PAS domain S-box-containing protein